MSFIVEGNNEKSWQSAGWVFYAMAEELVPVLRQKSPEIAGRFLESYENKFGDVDLSDYLPNKENRQSFETSVAEAVARLKEKGSSGWSDPSRFEAFIRKVEELKKIA